MRLCVFEDRHVLDLEPLTLTRPAFDLLCGASSLFTWQRRHFGATETGAIVRAALAPLTRLQHPNLAVNESDFVARHTQVLVNARWLPPPEPLADTNSPRIGLVGEEIAYVIVGQEELPELSAETVGEWVEDCRGQLPHAFAGGQLMRYPWNLVEHNSQALRDEQRWQPAHAPVSGRVQLIGPADRLFLDPTADIEPFVVADTRHGPVIIDREAQIHSFSKLEGPCYVGPQSWVLAAKLRGGTIGPKCRVGGEFEASILHAHSNKYHDGFLGHSYAGEWVNLAAGTQVSDLRNDYGVIRCTIHGQRVSTGLTKVGAFFGDHTKTGLNTLINTGSVIGAFCGLLPAASYLPSTIPSFCSVNHGQFQERWDLRQLFATADTAMQRRGAELTDFHKDFLFTLFEQTAGRRRQVIRESEQHRLRRSM